MKRWPYDEQDINHTFPGDPDGSVVQRIAHAIFESSKAMCIDVHSVPRTSGNPQVRAPMGGEGWSLPARCSFLWCGAGLEFVSSRRA